MQISYTNGFQQLNFDIQMKYVSQKQENGIISQKNPLNDYSSCPVLALLR